MFGYKLIFLGLLFVAILVLQVWAYVRLRVQNKVIKLQSDEIKSQIVELAKQNSELRKLNEEKHQLIGIVSHDLKGPFNRIYALIQLMSMQGDKLSTEHKEYLGKIHQIVNDGLSMVRNLIDNRKLEDSALDMRLETLELLPLVKPLIKHYSTLAEKKNISVKAGNPESAQVLADRQYLTRILDNLLSNAIKFSKPGTDISIDIKNESDDVMLCVRDHGPGLSIEDQGKMFRKYQKLTPKPTSGESSTGLGLYIVKTLAEKMSATINYSGKEGEGSTFILRLKKVS